MNKKSLIIIGLQTVIIVVLFWVLVFYGKDEYEAAVGKEEAEVISAPSLVSAENGAATVTLNAEAQKQSGVATSLLQAGSHQSALFSFGTVVGIDALMEQRSRYLTAHAEIDVNRATIASSRQDYERLRLLNQDGRNVSDRVVAQAEATLKSEQARVSAAEAATAAMRDTIRQQWGDTLAQWATQPAGERFKRLLARQDTLIQVTLPIEAALPAENSTLMIETPGRTGSPIKATYVAPAPQTDATVQGKTYYYSAPSADLRAGMRVNVRLTEADKLQSGVIVPAAAVVWYANQPWVYRRQAADKFVRTPVITDTEIGDGWFNTGTLKAGDAVVTTGAQLLLSEEFKYQIKNENED